MKILMKTAMKKIMKTSLCAIVAVVLSTTTALAANFVATQSGYWDAETTWKSGAVPSSSDSVTGAENGPVVTVRDAREIAGIDIHNSSFELAVDGSDASLAVSGHYKANFGNYNGGRIVVRNGGTLSLNTLELVNNGGTTSGSYIYVTNGATLTASGLLKTTSSKDVFVIKNAEKVNLSADFELANESVRSGCQPDHELWWDGYGEFSVGGVMKVMGDGALRSGRASGSKSRCSFRGIPRLPSAVTSGCLRQIVLMRPRPSFIRQNCIFPQSRQERAAGPSCPLEGRHILTVPFPSARVTGLA